MYHVLRLQPVAMIVSAQDISMYMYSYLYGRPFNFLKINPLIHSILSCNLPEDQLDQIAHQDVLALNTKSQLLLKYM